ncbi:VGLL2 [Branchiostoma lanceolatum]|uniref:VGLL2 protein n=1 Tax=Branchiostoma lanceolatum TaxID=7740 RepID=A0A8J9YLW8_BRALA|nr:VGLL2 [Branchiostoma lanceolatum]
MSCIDVMFQPYQHHFFSHPAPTQQFELYRKMQESTLGLSSTSAAADFTSHSVGHTSSAVPSSSAGSSGTAGASAASDRNHKDSETNSGGGDKPPEAEYINSKCVLFTYFSGDCNSVVDEHFSRALSQPSSFGTDTTAATSAASKPETSAWKSGKSLP